MNFLGHVNKVNIKRCLYVNEKGFISIYALMLLSIFLLFSAFFVQRIYTYASIRQDRSEAIMVDIFIMRACKQYAKQELTPQGEASSTEEGDDSELVPDEDNESPTTWQRVYQGITLYFERQDAILLVSYTYQKRQIHVQVTLDPATLEIMNFAYVS